MYKKVLSIAVVSAMILSLTACGGNGSESSTSANGTTAKSSSSVSETNGEAKSFAAKKSEGGLPSYADIELGKDYTDLSANITMFNHRTDMSSPDYKGKNWDAYLADFNKEYPNIKVSITTDTNYADDALTHLQSGDYETIMMIPAVDKADLSTYFMSYGDFDTMDGLINYASTWEYGKQVYGVPSTATAQGYVYNKKVFEEAGISELPKTPEEFISDLKLIKDKTDAIPMYTNYAAGWTMGAWDAYIGINATGDDTYMNQKLVHTKDPFKDYGDGAHAYNVYKLLYDAVSEGLIEDDYTTTDWEGCKAMINNGKIGCMFLGSWAFPQMQAGGDNADDIGYTALPISINGKQYVATGADYSYGINVNASDDEKTAALVFVKWMTEESKFSYNEDGLPIAKNDTETKLDLAGVELMQDQPSLEGEEDYLNEMNSESELNINNGGNDKIQAIVEHAANKDKSFDEIMNEWNEKWGTNPYDEELSNLTRYNTPIRNDKKCCMNCTRIFCHLRDNNWHYCKEYNPTHWQEIYYVRFSYNKEPAPKPSLEQRINDSTKAYLEDYKKLLKHCDELEKEVPKKIITKPFNQKDLDVEEKYQEWSKKYWKDFEDTFDKEEHKIEGDGPFAGVTLYSAKPNEERQKAFFEKYKTCPMAAMAKDIGLIKEEK